MAKIFVDDLLKGGISNRNDLVVLAAIHARTLPIPKQKTIGNWKNRSVESLKQISGGQATKDTITNDWYKRNSSIKDIKSTNSNID